MPLTTHISPKCTIQNQISLQVVKLGMALCESLDHPDSQSHLEALHRVACDLIVESVRVPLGTRA